jgi:putative salt-induced outer membrane protein
MALLMPSFAADQIVLKNGDILTGTVLKKEGDTLTLKSEFLGELHMPWSAVKSLKSGQTMTVALPGGKTVTGTIETRGEELQVHTSNAAIAAPLTGIVTLRNPAEQESWERLEHPRLYEAWSGFFDIGLALARGNARTDTLTTAFTASRTTHQDKLTVHFNQIYGTARTDGITAPIASAVRGGWSYNRNVSSRIFFSTFNDYEHDRFQNLNLRFVAGAGAGVHVFRRERANLSFTGGADYSRENFIDHLHRNSGEANFGDDLAYKLLAGSTLTESFRIFPNLTDTGQYRLNADLGIQTALKRWLSWQVAASDRFLSNPVLGHQRNDLILSTGFRVSFAN